MSLTQRRPAHDDVCKGMPESKALRLARYLKEFVGLRSTTVYDVNKYESVLWFGEYASGAGVPKPGLEGRICRR